MVMKLFAITLLCVLAVNVWLEICVSYIAPLAGEYMAIAASTLPGLICVLFYYKSK